MGRNLWQLPKQFTSLVELLHWRAILKPEQKAYSFLLDGEVEASYLTYQELDRQAQSIAARLQSYGVKKGERGLLLYPPGLEFIAAFFGCLYAGVIAVPAYPPRANQSLSRLQAMVADAQATIALTTKTILANIEAQFAQYQNLQTLYLLATDNIPLDLTNSWQQPSINNNDLAFLQYTSGSTGTPKGVMVSHGNLLHNELLIQQAMQHTENTLFVGWLPLFHDMGLVGNLLQPLYLGIPCILMPPVAFLQKPWRWLQAISKYQATTSGGPNFAYDLCVRKITPEQRATLDLSSWEVAFNGAEPIRQQTLEQFSATFAECGFRRESFYPCYGMAETTLIVTGGSKLVSPVLLPVQSEALLQNQIVPGKEKAGEQGSRGAGEVEGQGNKEAITHKGRGFEPDIFGEHELGIQTIVGCGQVLQDLKIAIVNPETLTRCQPNEVGEIWVAGPSVTQGYWNQPEQTEYTFRAYLKDTQAGPFLRTGDLGFLQAGELFVTGRLKDLIIIRGRNHYPQDIEWSVEQSHPSLQPSGGAAFTIDVDGEEKLIIAQEVKRSFLRNLATEEVIRTIRQAVVAEHELQVYAVLLLKPGSIPKTTSGKIQRHACRTNFLAGSWESIASSVLEASPTTDNRASLTYTDVLALEPQERQLQLTCYLQQQVAQVLKLASSQINQEQPLTTLGIDSLMAIELQHTIETNLGIVLPMTSFLGGSSINQLATVILAQLTDISAVSKSLPAQVSETVTEYPLAYGQQALYFLHQLAPESPAYNIANAVRLRGEIDITALHQAFQSLVERHPILGATFSNIDGKPIQRVSKQVEICWQEEDAATWDEEFLRDRLIKAAYHPFNLEQDSLIRVRLFARSPTEHILLLVVHHIIADFWSLTVLVDELGTLYQAHKNHTPVTLPPLVWQYSDYVREQSQMLASPTGDRHWDYWQKQLSGELPILNLPTDRPRPVIQTYQGASLSHKLSTELTQKLQNFSRQRGVTLYMTLLAAFQVLLYRYTGQTDFFIGSPTTGRTRTDATGVVGYFVNPVVLRSPLSENFTFDEFLIQVRSCVLAALDHQDYPFARLVEQLQPKRDPSRSPLFQVMFVLHKAHLLNQEGLAAFALGETGAKITLGELELESLALEQRIAQFDLNLVMAGVDDSLSASWQYNTDLFDAGTIARMAGHFQTLLESIVADSQQQISLLPILTKLEQQQLLIEWNTTQVDYTNQTCLHQQFEAQVKQTPDAVAVVFETEQLTYTELNRRANQLAHYLQTLGVEPDVLVGICLERSLFMVISILATLKAGGAYLPLDPSYPQERLAFMVENAQVAVLLTQEKFLTALPVQGAQVVLVDKNHEVWVSEKVDNPVSQVTTDHLAYVIYTSGSTGKPKGVMNIHRGICNRLSWMQETYNLTTVDKVLQKTPFSFDVSVWEFFWPLTTGACLVIARPGGHQDSSYLVEIIAQEQITTLHFVPSMLQVFLEEPDLEACNCLRQVMCSGEVLPLKLQARFFERLDADLHNLYGPTEAAIDVTFWACERETRKQTVPIGRPIANTQIYLLDHHLQPVPIGVAGELHIGGVGLARGYLNQPELTNIKFIPNPFNKSKLQSERLYKTGDLARYLNDGNIEYLGRLDHQVKLRGFRIELGEIEALLSQHPALQQVVVLIREIEQKKQHRDFTPVVDVESSSAITGLRRLLKGESANSQADFRNQQLVAYCVTRHQPAPTTSELRQFLLEKLPEYMVPAAFVLLDAIPLTPNGKIDRQSLPIPGKVRPELAKAFVAPRTFIEKALAEVWQEVLDIEPVGIHDNFFELGGDSIRSIQVLSRATAKGLSCSLAQIFQYQTIESLAQAITFVEPAALVTNKTEPFSLISPVERQKLTKDIADAYPLARVQAGVIFHTQSLPDEPMYHDIFLYNLQVHLDVALFQQAIQQVVERHAILRTSFDLTNFSEPLQLVHQQVTAPFQVEDLRDLSPKQQQQALATWIKAEKRRNFDWSSPPLIRFFIHRLTEQSFYLTFSCHTSILDGWSKACLLTELLYHYDALLKGTSNALEPAPTIAYRDFVALERATLRSPDAQDFWRQKLAGCVTTRLARWVGLHHSTTTPEIGFLDVPISRELSAKLQKLARLAEVPLKNVLLAAHIRVMGLVSGESDILTGLESNGRVEAGDGEKTLGIHLNTVPLRLQLTGGTWLELVQQVFAAEKELLPFRRYPYADLHQLVGRQALQPLVETVFNYTNFHVYESLQNLQDVEVLGARGFGETHFTLRSEFNLNHASNCIQLDLECDLTQISHAQLETIGSYFQETLTAMSTQPLARYESQCLLGDRQRQILLEEWNQTGSKYPQDCCIHQYFEAVVAENPDAIAIVFADEQLSYQQLNQRANALAHYLQRLGVTADVPVALCVERSLEMIVGILAILKAGGAYVPLDPTYPQENLAFILEDAQVPVLLTQARLIEKLPSHTAKIVCLDSDWQTIARENVANPSSTSTLENLAYIIYTSGSTGKPKGVLVTQQNLAHSTFARISYYPQPVTNSSPTQYCCVDPAREQGSRGAGGNEGTLSPAPLPLCPSASHHAKLSWQTTSFLLIPSFAFDSSVAVIFWALCQGSQLVLLTEGFQRDIWQIAKVITQHQVSHWLSVPSLYKTLLATIDPAQLVSLQTVIVAGESCPTELVERHRQLLPDTSLFNEYGPTEATVWSSVYNCQNQDLNHSVPIGRPITNTQIYLLDTHLQPVPIGVAGEIYIGGLGVAQGYLNRPELTAQKFISHPLKNSTSERLYKTGDLGRYLPDGNIEFLGRIDRQVKMRGYRIELTAIEAILLQHPVVQEAIATVIEDSNGKRLIAYIVLQQKPAPTTQEFRSFLRQKLPEYMLPSTFVILEELPLTPSGKVDYRRLPTSTQVQSDEEKIAYIAPRTVVEEILEAIWSQVLGIEQVGIYNNFLELGGDSIQSIQIAAKAYEAGLKFSINQLFEYPTIAELATVVEIISPPQEEVAPIANLLSSDTLNFKPSDFPEAELTQEELNQLFLNNK
ncbi:non-ribosomal peptide synthetase [Nostoc sp. FACHB-190]|uniref:non-ribosomal peptide synthetase n=1 Tax=Nostoc sp. FACHB-190 TaxID=2692838 RepID=UPI00168272C8|nr:non-ribosomal peptide synthetase [Nostoc sp. FACHB-190]MBD2300898.1 amino acid adenylation domain-containing protein [Nostoc sp. FACHB-190]